MNTKKPKPPKALDAARLRRLADQIAAYQSLGRSDFDRLIAELSASDGLIIADKNNTTQAAMAGLRASATSGPREALINWGAAARRKLLALEA